MGSLHVPDPPCGTEPCSDLIGQMAAAAESRGVVGMAKGILMHSHGITPDEAFDVLVRSSQRQNRKLRLIAEELIGGASLRQAVAESSLTDLVGGTFLGGTLLGGRSQSSGDDGMASALA